MLQATGIDVDGRVNEVLIRFCAAFLDQGVAHWALPGREMGFFRSWLNLYRDSREVDRWLRGLSQELKRIESSRMDTLEIIDESLNLLGVEDDEREEFVSQTLLALTGWARITCQM